MPSIAFRTKKITRAQAKQILKALPKILDGSFPDKYGLRDVFYGRLAEFIFQKISTNFILKSKGVNDEKGLSWAPLAPATLKKRRQPWFLKKYPLAAQEYIMRVSDRMLDMLRPGHFDGVRYRPAKDQIFKPEGRKLILGTDAKYTDYAHQKRPIWPENMDDWIEEGLSEALQAVINHLEPRL